MKKMQEGSLMNNKDHINKLNNLEKDLANYKDLYEKQNYEYNRILNNRNKQNSNIINPDLIKGVNLANCLSKSPDIFFGKVNPFNAF